MNIPGKNEVPLWIGNYGFSIADKPDANGIQAKIKKSNGEGLALSLDQFNDLMDRMWREEF